MKPTNPNLDFYIGAEVHWMVGNVRRSGKVTDIYAPGKVSNLAVRTNREKDRVIVVKQDDGRVVMKLESDVSLGGNTK
jgi:hypothetical protein